MNTQIEHVLSPMKDKSTRTAPVFTREQLVYLNAMFPEMVQSSSEELLRSAGSRAVIQHIALCIQRQTKADLERGNWNGQ